MNRQLPYSLQGSSPVNQLICRELSSNIISAWKPFVHHGITTAKNFYRKNLLSHFGCVNAIEFSHDGKWLVSGGDDRRVLLWDVHKAIHGARHQPLTMQAEHASNVFAIACDRSNTKIYSGGNDDQVIVHDIQTRIPLDCFMHEQPVFGISVDPLNDSIFASACDSGRICIYDIRDSNADPFCLASSTSAFHAVMFCPTEPRLVVTANSKKGVALFDVRHPKKCLMKYGGNNSDQCCMSAKFSNDGRRIFVLRRRLPPVLYATDSTHHLYQFNHLGYYNSCTMKSCSFAGENDEFVLSGSDNFDLYVWKIPSPEPPLNSHKRFVQNAHLVLKGHRSIVNQVRYNPAYSIIASSGVEKVIKLFSPFQLPSSLQGKSFLGLPTEKARKIYSHDDYINLVMESGELSSLTLDSSRRNTKEDPRMMAFFDALIQRDIEGMDEDEELAKQRVSYTNTAFSFSSIFSDDYQSRSATASDSEDANRSTTSSRRSLVVNFESQAHNNIQVVQSPRLISDHSSQEDGAIPINIVREDLPNIESSSSSSSSSIELEEDLPNDTESAERLRFEPSIADSNSDHNRDDENNEEPVSEKSDADTGGRELRQDENIITKMISSRQEKLLEMARNHVRLEIEGRQLRRRRRRLEQESNSERPKTLTFRGSTVVINNDQIPASSSSSSSSSGSESTGSDSVSDSMKFKRLRRKIRPLLWRNKKRVLQSTTSDSDTDDNGNTASSSTSNKKRRKTPKSNKTPIPNKKHGASQETLTKLKMYLSSLKDNKPSLANNSNVTEPNFNNNEPCTSASVLLRDAIAAGLSQSNVIYENEESSLSSTSSSSTSSSDSLLERLVMNEVSEETLQARSQARVRRDDSSTPSDSDSSRSEQHSSRKNGETCKRKCSSGEDMPKKLSESRNRKSHNYENHLQPKRTKLDESDSEGSSSGSDITKLLPAAKSHLVKISHSERRYSTSASSSDEESVLAKANHRGKPSLSFPTPDSGIESSSRNEVEPEQDGRFLNRNETCSQNGTSSTDAMSLLLNSEQPDGTQSRNGLTETTLKKYDPKSKTRNYRSHGQSND